MSDALCGPSNALQNFQKHTSVDRTLQQDRLTSRHSPAQGFRSQNPNEGILDPEFAAFESTLAGPAQLPEIQHAGPFAAPTPPQFSVHNHAENGSWARDFQNLQISGPSHPIAQQRGPSVGPEATFSQRGRQDDFSGPHSLMQFQMQQMQHEQHQHQQSYAPRFQPSTSFTPSTSLMPSYGAPMNSQFFQESPTPQQAPTETFDESAFEAAFEQAKADMEVQAERHADTQDNTETVQENVPDVKAHEEIRIGSDTIPYADKEDTQNQTNDRDELAKTARQLIESVQHDQSQKFKQSNFLALMRRIRDREVHVEGNEFRETSQSLHPGGKYYPEGHQQEQPQQQSMPRNEANVDLTPAGPNLPPFDPLDQPGTQEHVTAEQRKDIHGSGVSGGQSDDNSLYAGWNYGDRWA